MIGKGINETPYPREIDTLICSFTLSAQLFVYLWHVWDTIGTRQICFLWK